MNFLLQPQLGLSKGTKRACTLLLVAQFVAGASFMEQAQAALAPSNQTVKRVSIAQTITGSVKDSDGSALAGASIRIKGGKGGATTGVDGSFKLDLPTGNETLIISMVGYKTKEVSVNGRSVVNIVLEDNTAAIDEVVVVGYGQQQKSHLTGAIATVNMKAIEDLPVTSLGAALAGQLPGVSVSGGYNRPGGAVTITVRNPTYLAKDGGALDGTTGSTSPLYVIDDVIRTADDFNTLDASEVESLSVLKDAAAAIYGARGAYGVIVVKTKKGKSGAPKLSYSSSYGVTDAYSHAKMMNAYQLGTYLNDYNETTSLTTPSVLYAADELDYFKNNSQPWLDKAWKSSMQVRQTLNVSGGNEKSTYYAGVSYNKQDGNFEKINFEKWTFRGSADIKLASNLKAGLSISADVSNNKKYTIKQGGSSANGGSDRDYYSLIHMSPFKPIYINGYPVNSTAGSGSADNFHLFEVQNSDNYSLSKNNGSNISAYLDYDVPFVKGLKAKVTYTRNYENNWGKEFGTKYDLYTFAMIGTNKHLYSDQVLSKTTVNNGDFIYITPNYSESYQLNGFLNYDKTLGKHAINILLGVEQNEFYKDGITVNASGLLIGAGDNLGYQIGSSTSPSLSGTLYEYEGESGRLSYLSRINYAYANKYLAELVLRRDASTNFAPDKRWGMFPSISLGWVISEEPFFKRSISWVDNLKIRGSFGLIGMDGTKPYQWTKSYEVIQAGKGAVFGGNTDRAGSTNTKVGMVNPELSWDSHYKYNGGIDAKFLKNRLSLTFDGYLDHGFNLITSLTSSVPLTVGATMPSLNYGIVDGFGYELTLGWRGQIAKDWSYNLTGFYAWNENKVLKADQAISAVNSAFDKIGQSSDQGLFGYKCLGMLRTQADVDALLAKYPNYTIEGTKPSVGMLYYEDVNGGANYNADGTFAGFSAPDGIINTNDRVKLADKSSNHHSIGLNLSTKFRNLSFGFTFGGSFGGYEFIESNARGYSSSSAGKLQASTGSNLPAFLTDHWTKATPDATYPSAMYGGQNLLDSDFWMISSFSMGFKNANISYELPSKLLNKLKIGSARAFITSSNPLNVVSPYTYKTFSTAYDNYPTLRSYSLGLNIGF